MRRRTLLRLGLGLVVLLGLAVVIAAVALSEPRPVAPPGPEADALARRMEAAIGADAWARTGAVRFTFAGRHRWLWDRFGGRARLERGDRRVLFRTADRHGVAFEEGVPLRGAALDAALADAWTAFCNDTFWLNPLVKLFDPGTQRALLPSAPPGAARGLLVTYESGGVTPGDAYLWHVGADDRPVAWQMWVRILPVGGLRMGWGGWQTLATGAVVSTRHEGGIMNLELTDVAAATDLAALEPGAFDALDTPQ